MAMTLLGWFFTGVIGLTSVVDARALESEIIILQHWALATSLNPT
jgi:hypothetical protein